MSPPKICIVGDNCVDLYPVQTKKFVGGNGVNTAVAVQRNGIHCGYLGIVGNDEDGKLIIETLQKEKIDCQRLRQSEGKTAWTIVHLEDGERIFFEDCLEVQRDFELEEKDYQYLKQYDWVHHTIFSNWNLEGKNQFQDYEKTILEQASRIKESGVNLSIDFSEQNNKDLIQSLGPMSEIGIFSRPGTLDSEIPQILQCLHEAGFALVIMTMGELGAGAFDGQEVFLSIRPRCGSDRYPRCWRCLHRFLPVKICQECIHSISIKTCSRIFGAFLHDRRCFLIIDMNPGMALINLIFPPI